MNLTQKIQSARMQNEKNEELKEMAKRASLYHYVQGDHITLLLTCDLDFSDFNNIGLCCEGFGLEIKVDDSTHDLSAGDRIIEVNGTNVLCILATQWEKVQNDLNFPCKIVFMRAKESDQNQRCKINNNDVKGLKDDIELIQTKLSEKLKEGRYVSSELSVVQQEKENLVNENTRLNHRIGYLEDQVIELENGMKQVITLYVNLF